MYFIVYRVLFYFQFESFSTVLLQYYFRMLGFPVEILEEIFWLVPLYDLVQAAKINRRMHAVASNKHNASGKRLAKQNRVTVYVNIYDGADSDNPGHEMVC